MVDKIGIDAGGSLVKVAYQEKENLHIKTFSNQDLEEVVKWLTFLSPEAMLSITGGKASILQSNWCHNSVIVNEFEAVVSGTRYLLQENNVLDEEFILVNIGTGTSIFHVTSDTYERVLGSGIGGGTLMGLGYLITHRTDFQTFTSMANSGDKRNSDLLVRDIYYPEEPPIYGDLTASNLGKVHLNKEASSNDYLSSVMQLIGETIILLARQVVSTKKVSKIVFIGGTVEHNKPLQDVFLSFREMMSYEPIFLNKGTHAGAIGALIRK
ncbi:type II pantothenate kinase [Ornithinibacillus scapharcae]|uniref:type II pantothenate kinase n=1 Tax=Ornithinibacillus scapharcae TaxID=1147159 RepID=UPI000225AE22|nr:type II pantothenate kinase [Ornithinibacillus scapharcae]